MGIRARGTLREVGGTAENPLEKVWPEGVLRKMGGASKTRLRMEKCPGVEVSENPFRCKWRRTSQGGRQLGAKEAGRELHFWAGPKERHIGVVQAQGGGRV